MQMSCHPAIRYMATVITSGKQTVKLYHSLNRGKAMYQLAFYAAARRIQKKFSDKAEAQRMAKQILGGLTNDEETIDALAPPELESLVAARKVLAPAGNTANRIRARKSCFRL